MIFKLFYFYFFLEKDLKHLNRKVALCGTQRTHSRSTSRFFTSFHRILVVFKNLDFHVPPNCYDDFTVAVSFFFAAVRTSVP